MKSFIKSHRKSGSNPGEYDHTGTSAFNNSNYNSANSTSNGFVNGVATTPKLSHSASAFSLRPKSNTSSPNQSNQTYNSSFVTSALPPLAPPPLNFNRSPVSPSPVSPQLSSHESFGPSNNGKRSRLKGLLKHKGSKSSLNSPNAAQSKPSSPVVASKSFVTFSDPNLPLPSQTPDFVVDRPIPNTPSNLDIINEEKSFFKNINDSVISASSITSHDDISLQLKSDSRTTYSSTGLENPIFITKHISNLDRSQYSFQSSNIDLPLDARDERDEDADEDPESEDEGDNISKASSKVSSGVSSQFSFEANTTYGRKTSIKYYKKQEDVDRQRARVVAQTAGRKFINDFIGEDMDVADLNEDLNYDDSDVEDDTLELFNRKLFSSDEEDGDVIETLDDDFDDDLEDDLLDEVNIESEDDGYESEQEHPVVPDTASQTHSETDQFDENLDLKSAVPKNEIVNNINKRMSQLTVDPDNYVPQQQHNMSHSQRNKLGLNIRTKPLKYYELKGDTDEDLKFLNARYSWYVSDEKAAEIQQKLVEMGNQEYKLSNLSGSSTDFNSPSIDKDDDSLLDEVNQLPEDFEFESCEESDPFTRTRISNSAKLRQLRSTGGVGLMAPSATTGTRIDHRDKTVTLFRSSSARNTHKPPENDFQLHKSLSESNKNSYLLSVVDQSDDDDSTLFHTNPSAILKSGHESPLTTISEGSFDSGYSPKI